MDYVLGLDLGETSLGWSIVTLKNGELSALYDFGVRIFSDGRESKSKEPLCVSRRVARGMRKRRDRYLLRRETLMKKLIKYGLMPADEKERKALEKENPYEARVRALEGKIDPYQLGRALFHINQRRGFKSNRKADRKNAEAGAMQKAMNELQQKMKDCHARTLGEYLYQLNKGIASTQEHIPMRVRSHLEKSKAVYSMYPTRAMYEDEVRQIFLKQGLTREIEDDLFHTIFYQRPLKAQPKGKCQFEPEEVRCYIAYPAFQKFRALQQINQLKVRDDFTEDDLTDDQKKQIKHYLLEDFSKLDKDYRLTFASVKKILGLNKKVKFNLESERRKGLDGDKTTALLKPLFGAQWAENQNEIVDLLLDTEQESDLKEKLEKYHLTDEQLAEVIKIPLPDGVGSLSLKAIHKINPYLEQGLLYDKAVVAAGYDFSRSTKGVLPEKYDSFIDPETGEIFEKLPYYGQALKRQVIGGTYAPEDKDKPEKYFGKINNPTVHIVLNQVRKLLDTLVPKYGHPTKIVVELARDLKLSQKQKKEIEKDQTQNEKDNQKIGAELERLGIKNNYDNRMKYKLWQDSAKEPDQRCCPFCGKPIAGAELALSAEFEIEHLLPFSRSYLDARSNKVLSCRQCNREKANRSPWEAFHSNTKRWNEILGRVERLPENKRWKFNEEAFERLQDENGDVLSRMLTDTQYMSKMARQYLCWAAHPSQVSGIPGQLTSKLRAHWGLNSILSEEKEKDRTDHRHHAIDAFVVACTDRGTLQRYSTERRDYGEMPQEKAPHLPYPNFRLAEVKDAFDRIVISHKPDHGNAQQAIKEGKTVARLHDATVYARKGERLTIRIPVAGITAIKDLDKIVDQSGTAEPIRQKIAENPNADIENTIQQYFKERNMRRVKTYHFYTAKSALELPNPAGGKPKYVQPGGNAYAEIYCPDWGKKAGKWQLEIISNYDAHQKGFVPNWRHTDAHAKLIMRLHIDDMVAYEENGETVIARVQKMDSEHGVFVQGHRVAKDEKRSGFGAAKMQSSNFRKITVTIDGKVIDPKQPKGDDDGSIH